MKEYGEVIDLQDDVVTLKVIKKPECGGCKACFFGKGENSSTIKAQNTIHAKIGEQVYFTVQKDNGLKASLIVYILPILFMGLGVAIGAILFKKEVYMVLSAGVGLAIGFLALYLVDKLVATSKSFQIKLEGVVPLEELEQMTNCQTCETPMEEDMGQTLGINLEEQIKLPNQQIVDESVDSIMQEYIDSYNLTLTDNKDDGKFGKDKDRQDE